MNDEELLDRVREMHERGSSPKRIAKALGLRPSAVAPLVRQIASLQQTHADPASRALLGCWISPGWSAGLGLDDAPPQWAAADPMGATDPATGGLAKVLIARQERASRASVCGFLVDLYCLGVKDALGPVVMGSGSLTTYSRDYFAAFDAPALPAPIDLAQNLVHGAVAYAHALGFEPAPDYADVAPYLGTPDIPAPIRFGRDGTPFYFAGPHDNPSAVVRTLEATVGPGNYHYVAAL
ncbi:hypothetical protein [Streptomyces sp. NPDC005533]|uniref:hypothetical protein n=1 Tax=Streptomyces sp. NPDC005533 TaxID=3364723 RepID=UPI0036738052